MLKKLFRVLIDTNVLIAAVKSRWTKSTELLAYLLTHPRIELVANRALIAEYSMYTQKLKVPQLLSYLLSKLSIIEPSDDNILTCLPFFSNTSYADTIHAATCLVSDAILITNDKDFKRIKEANLISIWTISEAIKKLLQ